MKGIELYEWLKNCESRNDFWQMKEDILKALEEKSKGKGGK